MTYRFAGWPTIGLSWPVEMSLYFEILNRLQNNVTDGLVTNELVTNGLPSEALAQDGGGRGTSYMLRTSEVEILFRAVTG